MTPDELLGILRDTLRQLREEDEATPATADAPPIAGGAEEEWRDGVRWHKYRCKWEARMRFDSGRVRPLGMYAQRHDAVAAHDRVAATRVLFRRVADLGAGAGAALRPVVARGGLEAVGKSSDEV